MNIKEIFGDAFRKQKDKYLVGIVDREDGSIELTFSKELDRCVEGVKILIKHD